MNAAQVNTLGGVCERLGVFAVVSGLVDVARYRGVPAQIRAWGWTLGEQPPSLRRGSCYGAQAVQWSSTLEPHLRERRPLAR